MAVSPFLTKFFSKTQLIFWHGKAEKCQWMLLRFGDEQFTAT
jgi:hypothetical protein